MFSCEYCDIFKNIYFEENMWTDASESGVICITQRFYRGLIFVKLSYLFQLSYILWKGIPGNGTKDLGRLQVGPRDPWPGTPKWDPKPGTPKVGPRTRDPKIIKWNYRLTIFYSLIVYSTPNSSLVSKLCINQFIRLTYFVASIQKQPLRCLMNFKEL